MENNKKFSIKVVNGVEGKAVYINDYRVAGNKPWGGGTVIWEGKCTLQDIISAIGGEDVLRDELGKKLEVGDTVAVVDGNHRGETGVILDIKEYRNYKAYEVSGIDMKFLREELVWIGI